ncbi:39136_t:CDS:1, partial [Gigaspora margarita]
KNINTIQDDDSIFLENHLNTIQDSLIVEMNYVDAIRIDPITAEQ